MQRTFDHAMQLWFRPEIERRQAAGLAPIPYELKAAQVLMYTDGRPLDIRLNEEVTVIGDAKLRKGITRKIGEPIYLSEIDGIENWRLPEWEDPNCGHLTVARVGPDWYMAFDFRYNKELARAHLQTATEFLGTAEFALESDRLRACADNLFSAAELGAKAYVMTSPEPGTTSSRKHAFVHSRFNLMARHGNVDSDQVRAFNELSEQRRAARYLQAAFAASPDQLRAWYTSVKGILESVSEYIE
jgi:uncharacterized protein (UPF0332 family)